MNETPIACRQKVAAVALPWRQLWQPDYRTPALSAYLESVGQPAEDIPLYLDVAQIIGPERYERLYRGVRYYPLYQDAIYAALLFPERRALIMDVLLDAALPEPVGDVLDVWEEANEKALAAVDWASFGLVVIIGNGVISSADLYFMASLYVAKRIKALSPGTLVGMAGTDFNGRIGQAAVENFPWVDFVINGEPEQAVAALAAQLGAGGGGDIPGVVVRRPDGSVPLTRSVRVANLDDLPVPSFHRYFDHPAVQNHPEPMVLVEGARGCWWDRSDRDPKLSCAFCNINTDVDGYRSKSIPRLIDEIRTQTRTYGLTRLALSDTITRPKDARAFFEALADADLNLKVTEVEAHVSLPFDTYAAMARAGVTIVQLGVEALVPSLLAKMNKGITVARTIAALRTCRELNLRVFSNLLVEYPDSTQEEVNETLRRLPLLMGYVPLLKSTVHVPEGTALALRGEEVGIKDPPAYEAMLPPELRDRLHLMFRDMRVDEMPDWQPVITFLDRWRQAYRADAGSIYHRYADGPDGMTVELRDHLGRSYRMVLTGPPRTVVLLCRDPITPDALAAAMPELPADAAVGLAHELVRMGTLAFVDGIFVSLPVRCDQLPNVESPPPAASLGTAESCVEPQQVFTHVSVIAEPLQACVTTLQGETVSLEAYRGQVVLIINTASRCHFTGQYAALERLHREFRDQGLRILAFPCNDFAKQEPGTIEQIAEFCAVRYGLSVELFDKLHVQGPEQHPLYACLTSGKANAALIGPVPWNFTKYVLNRQGKLVARFLPDQAPDDPLLRQTVSALLEMPYSL